MSPATPRSTRSSSISLSSKTWFRVSSFGFFLNSKLKTRNFFMAKFGRLWKTIGTAGAGVAALAAVNAHIRRNVQEPDEVDFGGDARSFEWSHGNISYHVGGIDNPGPPLVLVHGVGAGSSSFMWRRNF